ncbi:ABC transporter permease [Lentibacillus sp. CBA3610]|uniref:ABC transporter permease n=1 Tax=Lentibacillus sp. CBA3610 TaxID=2518176 RepID=UPI001595D8C6|nr:ABC transporter permease [Lentibacillus sp. CBA3610]
MVWQIVKKQGLTLLRNPMELLLLVGLPIILIAILGTALGGTMNGEPSPIDVKVAFVEHEDEEQQVDRFMNMIEAELPSETVDEIRAQVEGLMPVSILKENVFGSDEVSDMVEAHDRDASELDMLTDDDSYTAVIEVPENFTYDMLEYMVLDKSDQPELNVLQNETQTIGVSVVTGILDQFQERLTLGAFLGKNSIDARVMELNQDAITGDITTINQKHPITAKGYYAVGMVVMNVLLLASTIGTIAFREKKTHVFDRIILGNISRWAYFTGVLLSGMLFGFLQLLAVYTFAWLVFDVTWPDLIAFLTVSFIYAMAIGGIAVLLTAISYRIDSELITSFFSGILVFLMALLGGSFFPIGDMAPFFRTIGNLTPNGAGMSAYLAILRGDGIPDIWNHLLFLVIFALAAIIFAAFSFPRRGVSS